MQKKGLCDTCDNDKGCIFPRKFPVLECEEFQNCKSLVEEALKETLSCRKPK